VIEIRIMPPPEGAERGGEQVGALVALLRGVPDDGRGVRDPSSTPASDAASGESGGPRTRGRGGRRRPARRGSPVRAGAAHRARRPDHATEDDGEPRDEPWRTKQQLADHLGVTGRWIEYQQRRGLPRLRVGGINRYRVSEVEAWLRDRQTVADGGEGS
jgi:hypothetical protein